MENTQASVVVVAQDNHCLGLCFSYFPLQALLLVIHLRALLRDNYQVLGKKNINLLLPLLENNTHVKVRRT